MPSAFDKRFKRSGFPQHLTNFGEPIVYFFRNGGKRAFAAKIERNPPAFYGAGGEVILPDYNISFRNDCDCGVLASEIDQGDTIDLIAEHGDAIPTKVTVLKLQSQDSGVCVVACKGE